MAWNLHKASDLLGAHMRPYVQMRGVTADWMAQAVRATGTRCSPRFVTEMIAGRCCVTAKFLDKICDVCKVDDHTRMIWHRAAAKDYGFKIGDW